jgi:hypothetical protein
MENGILEVILVLEIVFMPNSERKRIFGNKPTYRGKSL